MKRVRLFTTIKTGNIHNCFTSLVAHNEVGGKLMFKWGQKGKEVENLFGKLV